MESSLSKDGGVEKNSEGCSYMVLYVQLSSYHSEKPSSKRFYILCECYFMSQCCCSPIIETRITSVQHYLKCMQLVMWLKSMVDSWATCLLYATEESLYLSWLLIRTLYPTNFNKAVSLVSVCRNAGKDNL